MLNDDGWYLVSDPGQPPPIQAPDEGRAVTVAGKPRDDLPLGTLNSILRQAGLKQIKK